MQMCCISLVLFDVLLILLGVSLGVHEKLFKKLITGISLVTASYIENGVQLYRSSHKLCLKILEETGCNLEKCLFNPARYRKTETEEIKIFHLSYRHLLHFFSLIIQESYKG